MARYFNYARKFQEGGPVPAEGGAPAGGGDPMQQILEAAIQAVQSGDGNLALQVCEMLVQLAQGGQGGPPPEEAAPEGEPVYRAGGKLVKRIIR